MCDTVIEEVMASGFGSETIGWRLRLVQLPVLRS